MTIYYFEVGKEKAEIKIDKDRKLFLSTSKTKFLFLPLTEKLFLDRAQKLRFRFMNLKLQKLTEQEIDVYIISEFAKMGYAFIKKEND